ncbi:hypothetical protein DM02DRAFT_673662 [Periconia macrospinosa]|uniref:Zn(2)-C6 fungal-type domain-containing protein n=1 Tax=Periconia macrospinosa TaxID=97972 RepID=A0A2V1DIU5_9PLEO|nr:hypothetical protein DM02DRAFT_673662 [Periconia macrospinosa]
MNKFIRPSCLLSINKCNKRSRRSAKRSSTKMASSSTSHSKALASASSASQDPPELSDVQCYTCRKRHIKCDRTLPTCGKCKKKGVPCLGYQKPLRWADGVAVRGKLKGKSTPVVDENIINMVQGTVQQQANTTFEKAARVGVSLDRTFDQRCSTANCARFMKLLEYYNSTICAERVTIEQTKVLERHLPTISAEVAERLPPIIANCILGFSAVHMASRNPGDKALEHLALEAKVHVYQHHNQLLTTPQYQGDLRPDVAACIGGLVFAIDMLENGMNRWKMHTLGSMHIISSLGGVENLAFHYPHLQVMLFQMAHFETLWVALSHEPITMTKHTTRTALESLCYSPLAKSKCFNPCPTPLTLAMWDLGVCAQKALTSDQPVGLNEMYKRDRILLQVLAFQPKDAGFAGQAPKFLDGNPDLWEKFNTTWKAAITILVLRYLYLGRQNLYPNMRRQRSSSSLIMNQSMPSYDNPQANMSSYSQARDELDFSDSADEFGIADDIPDYLTPGLHSTDPFSRSGSPAPPPHIEPPNDRLWHSRYEMHDEAFSNLYTALAYLHDNTEPLYARYLILPIMVIGLVSRPDSKERTLCLSYSAKFEEFISGAANGINAGNKLNFSIPWEALDVYSEMAIRDSREVVSPELEPMLESAPEWNWWDMLKALDLTFIWPVTAGTTHLECGTDFWAFEILSSIMSDESFSSWLQETNTYSQ